ncbi:MAG: T9SS type A sorting domain-containing protein [Prolixibacteraceae bacterium]|nr:T9SS type A sorting domain-containing protein [Prolixibacteraceae bacterium]
MKKIFLLLLSLILVNVYLVSAQMYSQVSPSLNIGDVYYMTKEGNVDASDVLWDQQVIDDLSDAGYNLTLGYPGEGGTINVNELNSYDLVVVGRNISSGDFKLYEDWAELEVPVLMLSGYIIRNSRLRYLNSGSLNREVTEATEDNMDRITKALVADPADPAFNGVEVDADNRMDYMTWFYDYMGFGIDSFATTSNGKLLASIVDAETAEANGNVLAARWEPGVETYDGSGVIPQSYRTYIQMGADDKSDPKKMNYVQYTPESFRMILNEMNFLIRTGKEVAYMVKEGNVDGEGVLIDQQVIDDLMHAGYKNITQTYPGEGGTINKVELNNSDLVVVGRNISSGDFKLYEDWAELEVPVLMLSGYIIRNSRLRYLNSGSLNREVTEATDDNMDRITKALVADPADSAFIGVEVGADDKMDYMTWFYDYMGYGIDSFATTSNGKLLASIVDAETAEANGNVLAVRWEPGVETYEGSGMTPQSYRTYIQMGADDKSDPKKMNYAQYTDASFQLILNEMNYLCGTYSAPGIVLSDDATLASIELSEGTLSPAFSSDVTNYSVELPAGTTDVPVVTVTTSDENAVVNQVDAESLPGNTVVKVTSQDEQNEITYLISFSVEGGGSDDVVEPGMGTLETAIAGAADGDVIVLQNGGQYDIISPLVIDKKLTIKAEDIPELPALENMPIISNMFTSIQVFALNENCDLSLIGIDVDALGGSFVFDPMGASDHTVKLYVNRCRLHNTTDDIFNDDGSYANNITLGKVWIRNSFIYDSGDGHGIYTKNFNSNGSEWQFENLTIWNLGQQFTWIRVYGDEYTQPITFDHITGYNLSTSADNKELFGNDEKTAEDEVPEANLNIAFKNNLLANQASTNDGSLIFKNSDGFHDISINNNVLYECQPILNQDQLTLSENQEGIDPSFADPDNGDFTVNNADLYSVADDGKIVGATYWHPDFVDDFSDISNGIKDLRKPLAVNIAMYPNPFTDFVNFNIELTKRSDVSLKIINIDGRVVKNISFGGLSQGNHKLNFNTSEFNSGIYIYQVMTDTGVAKGSIIKR